MLWLFRSLTRPSPTPGDLLGHLELVNGRVCFTLIDQPVMALTTSVRELLEAHGGRLWVQLAPLGAVTGSAPDPSSLVVEIGSLAYSVVEAS